MPTPVFYKRKLPHWQPAEETFFITYRVAGTLPLPVIVALKEKYLREKLHPDNQTSENKIRIWNNHFFAFENELEKNIE